MSLIWNSIHQIAALCQKHKVKQSFAFGSVLTDRFTSNSDVDFVANFDKEKIDDPFINFFDFKDAPRSLLGREVDLLDETAISNKCLKQEIDATKMLVY